MNIENILSQLISENGVSGNEFSASHKAAELLEDYLDVNVDAFGERLRCFKRFQ